MSPHELRHQRRNIGSSRSRTRSASKIDHYSCRIDTDQSEVDCKEII
jgi:hypothetical protein